METYYIGTERLTLDKLEEIIESGCEIALSEEAIKNIEHCRNYLDEKMKNREKPTPTVTVRKKSQTRYIKQQIILPLQRWKKALD